MGDTEQDRSVMGSISTLPISNNGPANIPELELEELLELDKLELPLELFELLDSLVVLLLFDPLACLAWIW